MQAQRANSAATSTLHSCNNPQTLGNPCNQEVNDDHHLYIISQGRGRSWLVTYADSATRGRDLEVKGEVVHVVLDRSGVGGRDLAVAGLGHLMSCDHSDHEDRIYE